MPLFLFSKLKTRLAIQIIFWIFVVLTFLLAFNMIDIRAHDDEWFLAWLMGISAVLLFLPWLLFKIPALKRYATEPLVAWIEILLAAAMCLSWIGSFGPYRWAIGYDSFVHYTASILAAVGFVTLVYTISPSMKRNWAGVVIIAIVLSFLAGIGNEAFEYYGDMIWGTQMYGEAGQSNDTAIDYVFDAAGAALGVILAIRYRHEIFKLIKS